jgi:hypothetical protein
MNKCGKTRLSRLHQQLHFNCAETLGCGFNFLGAPSVVNVFGWYRPFRLDSHRLRGPNLPDNCRLCLLLPGGRWDIRNDSLRHLDEVYPNSPSFDHDLRSRMPGGEVAFWERWQDNVGYRCVDSQYL